jgi:hypothetical protein
MSDPSPGVDGPVERSGQRPVEDEQVDLVDAELAGALVEGVERLVVAVVADPHLGLDEHVGTVDAGSTNGVTDAAFVAEFAAQKVRILGS